MNPEDFITLAGRLVAAAEASVPEARHRAAASRAYYGAFYAVSSLLSEWGFAVRRNAYGHQDAYSQLWQSGHRLAQEVAGLLDDLRTQRIRADYRLEDQRFRTPDSAKSCVEQAAELLIRLSRCRADADEIKAAIEKSQARDT